MSRQLLSRCTLVLALGACGPIAYMNQVTRDADNAVEAARGADAEKFAPYWWIRATEYLHKARERAAAADFGGANRFGKLATYSAQQALVDTEAARGNPDLLPIDAKPKSNVPVPAKDDQDPAKGGISPAKE